MRTRNVDFVAPSVDCDANPTWSPDGKQIVFTRRPGTPFGLQNQQGTGSLGNPSGPATGRAGGAGCGGGGGGGGRGGQPQPQPTTPAPSRSPGLYTATFANGSVTQILIADVADVAVGKHRLTADAAPWNLREVWHNPPNDRTFAGISNFMWADKNLIFRYAPPDDEWDRYYSLDISKPQQTPFMLTTTDGLIEDATSIALSPDGKTFYYTTNAKDIERRHIWAVPTAGGTPVQLSSGEGIETYPQPLGSGKQLAVMYFGAKTPASVGIDAGCWRQHEDRVSDSGQGIPNRRSRCARNREGHGAGWRRREQSAFPAQGSQAGREAASIDLRTRWSASADAARLPLHAVLPLGLRCQSVARVSGLCRPVGELPLRESGTGARSSEPPIPAAAATRNTRMCWLPGSTCRHALMSIPRGSVSGDFPTVAC